MDLNEAIKYHKKWVQKDTSIFHPLSRVINTLISCISQQTEHPGTIYIDCSPSKVHAVPPKVSSFPKKGVYIIFKQYFLAFHSELSLLESSTSIVPLKK